MGNSSWTPNTSSLYSSTYVTRAVASASASDYFKSRKIVSSLDPKNILIRESCDSAANPNSSPIIIGLDVSGSMGVIAHEIAKGGLGRLIEGIHKHKPISDPHVMFMAIGDVHSDTAPLQASQFEADIKICEQLDQIYVEGGGGGNDCESYDLPWYFAAKKTAIDCFSKRGKKGHLFTIGDEMPTKRLTSSEIKSVFGKDEACEQSYSVDELLQMAQEKYNVFHLIIEQGNYAMLHGKAVTNAWKQLLGHRAILVSDYTLVPEIILAALAVQEGQEPEMIIEQYQNEHTRSVIKHALFD